jgi:hypothetical protein
MTLKEKIAEKKKKGNNQLIKTCIYQKTCQSRTGFKKNKRFNAPSLFSTVCVATPTLSEVMFEALSVVADTVFSSPNLLPSFRVLTFCVRLSPEAPSLPTGTPPTYTYLVVGVFG